MQNVNGHARQWWKEAVIYQVWPRSFMDSDGDGVGDLRGVLSRLDHIAGLGVDVLWLSPHFDSPNVDNGYDIRDYRKVMPEFGTMADFDALLTGVKARGMCIPHGFRANALQPSARRKQCFRLSRRAFRASPLRSLEARAPRGSGRAGCV